MTNSHVDIRKATLVDIDDIVALNHALFQEDAGQRDPFTNLNCPKEHGKTYFSQLLAQDNSICFLAEDDGEIIGYLIGYLKSKGQLRPIQLTELESMFVQSEFRDQGIGSELVNRFQKWSQERGADRIFVTAYMASEKAVRFYRRLGFKPESLSLEQGIE